MSHNSRNLLEIEVKILIGQIAKVQPGVINTGDYTDANLKALDDNELISLVDEFKDLLRSIGGVRKR